MEVLLERLELPPDVVIRRLPLYARSLRYLQDEGIQFISSQGLGTRINVTAAQIRKDLSYFGEFGKQGIGYNVRKLLAHIEHILGLSKEWLMVLTGVGHLGQAIVRYEGFGSRGVRLVGIFDNDPAKIGQVIEGFPILPDEDMPRVIRELGVKIAVVAVPASQAQGIVDTLVTTGIRAILNYAPVVLRVPDGICVRYIDPITALHSMTYYLAREEDRR
jgi:redox-sensing transcriptional repressor